ncbi:MAG: hypothetical protein K8W52_41195 [Deltaproteobacteria bacterium]|nr:hypothetical protein [Deltaproteobacteria bacterium]
MPSLTRTIAAAIGGMSAIVAALQLRPAPTPAVSPFDRPTAEIWPAVATWSPTLEDEYAAFVARLGDAVEARTCRGLQGCLRDPAANLLWDGSDATLDIVVDCADLPYLLRAYFAFKRRLPFGFVSAVDGAAGRDIRYTRDVHPVAWKTWRDFPTPRDLFEHMVNYVHSGMFRTAPTVEDADFYPVAVDRRAIRPGAIFYDPNGHVLVVARRTASGAIYLLDGHPDGTLTWTRFGEALALGGADQGGGFRAFRPLLLAGDALVRTPNAGLPLYDPDAQHDRARWQVDGTAVGYHAWIRGTVADDPDADPVDGLRDEIRALCRDVGERLDAVDLALAGGLADQPHPPDLPENIYGTDGDWELYSTPSRDARLKAAVRETANALAALPDREAHVDALAAAWREEVARPACRFAYYDSRGLPVAFTIETVIDRLFELSFDPYHCPELRWGAPAGSAELASCPDDADKRAWYAREQRLRNQIDRDYGAPTPLDRGPLERPAIDPRRWLIGEVR